MISASLNHCKKKGAEPGRRFLKQPVAKLEPVIAGSSHSSFFEHKVHKKLLNQCNQGMFLISQNTSNIKMCKEIQQTRWAEKFWCLMGYYSTTSFYNNL